MSNKKEKIKEVLYGDREGRVYLCSKSRLHFAYYYFTKFLKYKLAPFHYDMVQDWTGLIDNNKIDFLMWIMFRESAKTSWAKINVIHDICYKKRDYILWDSYDKGNSESNLYDIALELQTNKYLIADFGNLYYEERKKGEGSKLKRISNFITANGIKVEAFSTQESTRGRVYGEVRPDLTIVDDFETAKTKRSVPVTQAIIEHLDEMRTGLAPNGKIVYLGNFITESGSVNHIMEMYKNNKRARIRVVNVLDKNTITWPDKYVLTKKEAMEINKNRKYPVVSIEQKREDLGNDVFQTEMMNNPAAASDMIFDRAKVEVDLQNTTDPVVVKGSLKVWSNYNPKHRYAIGADTADGGGDHNASVIIDFSTNPAKVVATYKNDEIKADIFAFELKNQGNMFGECLIAPEVNNTGYATITQLKLIYDNIYQHEVKDRTTKEVTKQLGWRATSLTVPDVIYQFKSAYEDGEIEIPDKGLLEEMKYYTQAHMEDSHRRQTNTKIMTRHFDKLRAAAIAWEMRKHAEVANEGVYYKQKPYRPISDYEA